MKTYRLVFKKEAKKEWDKLDHSIRLVFSRKLKKRLQNPYVPGSQLGSMPNCYKIKLRNAGYRLVYQVREKDVVVSVIAVGKRNRNLVYKIASGRIITE